MRILKLVLRLMVLMGCKRSLRIVISAILSLGFLSFTMVHGSRSYNSSSLDALIRNFATEMYRVLPFPFVKRLAIVYQNLGNWSDYYYQVPGYSLVVPVVGFTASDARNLSILGNETMLHVFGDLIAIRFSNITMKDENSSELKCVKFGDGGLIQFRNLTEGNTCLAEGNGRFSIIVLYLESKKKKTSIWWLIAFVICAGVILMGLISFTCYELVRSKKIRKLMDESDKGVVFDMTWIGSSKMSSASMVRTQPVLEHGDIP